MGLLWTPFFSFDRWPSAAILGARSGPRQGTAHLAHVDRLPMARLRVGLIRRDQDYETHDYNDKAGSEVVYINFVGKGAQHLWQSKDQRKGQAKLDVACWNCGQTRHTRYCWSSAGQREREGEGIAEVSEGGGGAPRVTGAGGEQRASMHSIGKQTTKLIARAMRYHVGLW